MKNLRLFVLPFVMCVSVPAVQAQVPVQIGARVRITGPMGRSIGILQRVTPDTVVVAGQALGRGSLSRMDVSAGRKSHLLAGMGIGLAGGAVVGLIVAVAATPDSYYGTCRADEINVCPIFAGLGAGAGLVIGAVIGGLTHSERWRPVQLRTVQVSPVVSPGGALGVSIRLRF